MSNDIDTSTFFYYPNWDGTLTGKNNLQGEVLELTRRGPAFQTGVNANFHDTDVFGGSGWFNWERTQGHKVRWDGEGDINIDIICAGVCGDGFVNFDEQCDGNDDDDDACSNDCKPNRDRKPAKLGNKVWDDLDCDGLQDKDEEGVAGVQIDLFSCLDGDLVASTQTSDHGKYYFMDLDPGAYQVQVTLPAGSSFTEQDAGDRDRRDSRSRLQTAPESWRSRVSAGTEQSVPAHDSGLDPLPSPELSPAIVRSNKSRPRESRAFREYSLIEWVATCAK